MFRLERLNEDPQHSQFIEFFLIVYGCTSCIFVVTTFKEHQNSRLRRYFLPLDIWTNSEGLFLRVYLIIMPYHFSIAMFLVQ